MDPGEVSPEPLEQSEHHLQESPWDIPPEGLVNPQSLPKPYLSWGAHSQPWGARALHRQQLWEEAREKKIKEGKPVQTRGSVEMIQSCSLGRWS